MRSGWDRNELGALLVVAGLGRAAGYALSSLLALHGLWVSEAATGVIKGACRHLVGDRPGTTGARWGLDGAEAILTLRAVISNGDYFEEHRRFHLAPEHQRRYPGTAHGQYTLGA